MLHDILHHLSPAQRWSHAKLLAHLAAADGNVGRDELAFFEQRLGASLLSPERKAQLRESLIETPELEECMEGMDGRAVKLALRDACLMALADRDISENEKLKLIGIADRVGMSEKQVNELIDWVVKGYHWMQEGYDLLAIDV
jgi:uncharacterized tellurite resistance protein B-like protein